MTAFFIRQKHIVFGKGEQVCLGEFIYAGLCKDRADRRTLLWR